MINIYIDVDGVILNTYDYIIDTYNTKYNTNYNKKDITDYNLKKTKLGDEGIAIFKEREFFTETKPYEDYRELVRLLEHPEVNLKFLTSAMIYKEERKASLEICYPELLLRDEEYCLFRETKTAFKEGDILLDDYVENIRSFEASGGEGYLKLTETNLYKDRDISDVRNKVETLTEFIEEILRRLDE